MGKTGSFEDDAELVQQSLAGNREAFAQIVGRYQALICSLAFNATGNLGQSEELAQETFLAAWKQLHSLREPGRLRSWLCGIVRNLTRNAFRKQPRDPVYTAQRLENAHEVPTTEPMPSEQTISREEQALLWRSLEAIPEVYREPMILFYREHQSVQCVAEQLELSPEAVKQRLARGRRLLQDKVATFVESALERTRPGKAFTIGVVVALPVMGASSATAATVAGTGAKTALSLKVAAAAGLGAAVLGPLLGILGSIFGSWSSIKNTRSLRERRFMIRMTYWCSAYVCLFLAAVFTLVFKGRALAASNPGVFFSLLGLLTAGYATGLVAFIIKTNRRQQQIRREEGTSQSNPWPESVSPRRLRWNVYGTVGGTTAGMLAWLIVQASQKREWLTLSATILFGVSQVILCGRAWMKDPKRRTQIVLRALSVSGAFLIVVGIFHWNEWTRPSGVQTTAHQTVALGLALATVAVVGMAWVAFRRPARKQDDSASQTLLAWVIPLLLLGSSLQTLGASGTVSNSWTLPNGLRVVCLPFANSTNVSIFTYLPMGLTEDGPGETQWSHLIEHLVIRSTISGALSSANAETLPDHMRLDFYGSVANWKEGLSHHRRWISGVPFTSPDLAAEKPKVKSEADYTVKNLATHKFAMAAWAQGVRHGLTNAAVQGDIDRATLKEMQTRRDARLSVLNRTVVCFVGGITPDEVRSASLDQLGNIHTSAQMAPATKIHPGRHEMTWDLPARHLVLSWPIHGPGTPEFAALLVGANWLNVQFFSDNELRKITGMIIAGADLRTPESDFFYVSASLRPGASFAKVEALLRKHISELSSTTTDARFSNLSQQQAQSLTSLPDPEWFKSQMPPGMSMAVLESNVGLQWGMAEFRYGSQRTALAQRLAGLSASDISQVAARCLLEAACVSVRLQDPIR